jgi:type II secretory pathway component PulF
VSSFQYTAVDASGQRLDGTLDVTGRSVALQQLRQRGLTPVSVEAVEDQAKSSASQGRKFTRRQAEDFCRELGHLLSAGIPMSRALGILCRQARNGNLEVLQAIHDEVTGGSTLADSMARHPRAFTRVQVAMVQAGEAGGFLSVVLGQIADFQSRERDLKGRVRGALAYPTVLVVVSVGVLVFLLQFFIPKFSAMFESLGGSLPLLTRIVVGISELVVHHGPATLMVLVVGVLVLRRLLQTDANRLRWQRGVLASPLIGTIVARLALVRFCRMLGTLIHSGVPLVAALRVAKEALGNDVLAEAMTRALDDVVRGRSLSRSLASCAQLFPLSVVEMLGVAEEAGRLDEELQRLANVYETELDRDLHLAVSVAEPLVLFVMAGLIGTIVIGMLLPIFSLQDLIR